MRILVNVGYNILKEHKYMSNKIDKKVNGRWSKAEQNRFMQGLAKFGRNWVEVQKVVKTRTLTQVRSHAQKVFLKMSE